MIITNLTTLGMHNPVGIDINPYFSWIMESDQENVLQTKYRIVVKTVSGETVWDSGRINSDISCFIDYRGKDLLSRARYNWTVEVWDNQDNKSVSEAFFETALLNQSEWKAQWVEPFTRPRKRKKGFGQQPPATMFRKEFRLESKIANARLNASCHGIYRLSINNQHPDSRELAPEFTVYDKYLSYQTYNVTSLLNTGVNAIGMYVGDGWFCGPRTQTGKVILRRKHAVIFQLEVEYEDGSRKTVLSDQNVKTSDGPVRASDLFDGELFDANYLKDGWDSPNYDDNQWSRTKIAPISTANLTAQYGPVVRTVKTMPAVDIYKSPKDEMIVDFGQVLAGRIRVKLAAPTGSRVIFDLFETPDRDGNYFSNIAAAAGMSADQKMEYISDGTIRWYEPLFTFSGFRYARVCGLETLSLEDISAVVITSDMRETGTFECSRSDLNRLYENTRWSQQSNMISIPTDCPQREKAGWTGDILVYAATSMLNSDTGPFLIRWLKNLALSQTPDGIVPFTVPFTNALKKIQTLFQILTGNFGMLCSAGWGDAAVAVPWSIFDVTGNTHVLREQYDSMKKWCDYIIRSAETKRGKRKIPRDVDKYLWNTGFHFGEWLIPSQDIYSKGITGIKKAIPISSEYTAPIFGWQSVKSLADIACILGKTKDQVYYSQIATKMKKAISVGLIDDEGRMPVDLMGAYVLPVYFDLVPEHHKASFHENLVRLLEDNNYCLDTGFLGTPFILDAFCKIGRLDLAYKLLYQENSPSWLNQLKNGATSIWESWTVKDESGNPQPVSLNHYAFGCIDEWMFRTINGIDKAQPGFKKIIINPRPDDSLEYAKRTFQSSFGEIESSWRKQDQLFHLEVKIPANTTALVILPDGSEFETGSGRYSYSCICPETTR